jgi:hypothetical protein
MSIYYRPGELIVSMDYIILNKMLKEFDKKKNKRYKVKNKRKKGR